MMLPTTDLMLVSRRQLRPGLLLLLMLCLAWSSTGLYANTDLDDHIQFREANQTLGEGKDPALALEQFLAIEAQRGISANLAFNIASCHYRLGNWGLCRLYLERALLLTHHHPDAENNLRVLLNRLKLEEPEPGAVASFAHRLGPDQWYVLGLLLILAPMLALLFNRTRAALGQRSLNFPSATFLSVAALLLAMGAASLFLAQVAGKSVNSGVVIAEEAYLRQSPFEQSEAIATVKQARKLRILDSHQSYFRCEDQASGIQGWISKEAFAAILH